MLYMEPMILYFIGKKGITHGRGTIKTSWDDIYLMEVIHLNILCSSCAKYLVVSGHEALSLFLWERSSRKSILIPCKRSYLGFLIILLALRLCTQILSTCLFEIQRGGRCCWGSISNICRFCLRTMIIMHLDQLWLYLATTIEYNLKCRVLYLNFYKWLLIYYNISPLRLFNDYLLRMNKNGRYYSTLLIVGGRSWNIVGILSYHFQQRSTNKSLFYIWD